MRLALELWPAGQRRHCEGADLEWAAAMFQLLDSAKGFELTDGSNDQVDGSSSPSMGRQCQQPRNDDRTSLSRRCRLRSSAHGPSRRAQSSQAPCLASIRPRGIMAERNRREQTLPQKAPVWSGGCLDRSMEHSPVHWRNSKALSPSSQRTSGTRARRFGAMGSVRSR